MNRYLILLCLIFISKPLLSVDMDSLLSNIYIVLNQEKIYDDQRLSRIRDLKERSTDPENLEDKFLIYDKLYTEYQTFQYDSAFSYASQLIKLGYMLDDSSKIAYGKMRLGFILLSSGMFKETYDTLNTLNSSLLPDSVIVEYYSLMSRAYYDLSDYNNDNYYSDKYRKLGNAYIDSVLQIADKDHYAYLYLRGLKNLRNRRFAMAEDDLKQLIEKHNISPHEYAIAASTLSYIYLIKKDTTQAIRLLSKAAIYDLKTATKETSAMLSLSEILFRLGEIDHADLFIKKAMRDAVFYGAKQRKIQVGTILPIIAAAKLANVESQRRLLVFYALAITLLVITVVIFTYIISKQYKKLKKADSIIQETNADLTQTVNKLQEADKIKDEYIGYYFNINSEYLNKIEKLKKDVDRKLMDKKFEDIRYIINNIHLKTEREKLYHSFDHVFLKLFPDFVNQFNAFFADGNRIHLESDELMNTELRIFALIRMGISDSDKIAGILGYSVNTIYSYKNRVKSKSLISNELFEAEIMHIKGQ